MMIGMTKKPPRVSYMGTCPGCDTDIRVSFDDCKQPEAGPPKIKDRCALCGAEVEYTREEAE